MVWRSLHPTKACARRSDPRGGLATYAPNRKAFKAKTLASAARTGDIDSLTADLTVLGRSPATFAAARIQLAVTLGVHAGARVGRNLCADRGPQINLVVLIGSYASAASSPGSRCHEQRLRLKQLADDGGSAKNSRPILIWSHNWSLAAQASMKPCGEAHARVNTPGLVMIRDTIASARVRRRSEWAELGDLATRARLPELAELVTAVQLAATDGARVRASLQAKAKSLRAASASEQLAAANRASEYMGGPLIGMLLAFLAVVLAPALAQVLAIN